MVKSKQSWLDKLERKWGKYAIHNLSLYLIVCYAFGYILQLVNYSFLDFLTLNPERILHGQVWRIFTWILVPPDTSNFFFVIIMLFFYYSIGTSLERTWGAFRYNVYLFSGMLFTVIGGMLLYVTCTTGLLGKDLLTLVQMDGSSFFILVGRAFSTYYVNMSIFLAYAATFPDMQVLLMFIFPIKVKILGVIYAAFLIFDFFSGSVISRFIIGASLLNFIIFFLTTRNMSHMSPKQIKRRQDYKRRAYTPTGVSKHKCAICGRTESDGEDMEFRFCSKCDGNYEYCQEHLFTHEHVKRH